MQGYDILMLGVMAIAVIRGYTKGLAWQISSIASIFVSYFVAYKFKDRLTPMIELADPWRGLVAMMVLFVGTSLLIWFIFQNVKGAIEKAKFKDFDHQLGAIFGGIKGAAWCTAITIVALSFLTPGMSQQIVNSHSGGYIARLLASSKRIIPPEVQQVVQPYIQRAEDQLQTRPDGAALAQDGNPLSLPEWEQPVFPEQEFPTQSQQNFPPPSQPSTQTFPANQTQPQIQYPPSWYQQTERQPVRDFSDGGFR